MIVPPIIPFSDRRPCTMPLCRAACSFALILAASAPAGADSFDRDCSTGTSEARIPACTKVLEGNLSRPTRAVVLYRRGLAFSDEGNDVRAVEDFTASLTL